MTFQAYLALRYTIIHSVRSKNDNNNDNHRCQYRCFVQVSCFNIRSEMRYRYSSTWETARIKRSQNKTTVRPEYDDSNLSSSLLVTR